MQKECFYSKILLSSLLVESEVDNDGRFKFFSLLFRLLIIIFSLATVSSEEFRHGICVQRLQT